MVKKTGFITAKAVIKQNKTLKIGCKYWHFMFSSNAKVRFFLTVVQNVIVRKSKFIYQFHDIISWAIVHG